MPIEKKNLEICLSVHTVHCTHARTLCALALCGKGLSKIFQNTYETRPWPAGLDGIVARIQFGWVHFGIVSTTRFARSALSSA